MLTWKIVGASKVSVIYIYIYIYRWDSYWYIWLFWYFASIYDIRRQCDIRKQCNQMMALLKACFEKKKKKVI